MCVVFAVSRHLLYAVQDYVFSILTGYHDPPAGIEEEREGQFFNVYFPGQWISMQQALFPDAVEYDDGGLA